MMFCPNSSNQMNPLNEGLVRMNGWSQVVPQCMPWATPTMTDNTPHTPTQVINVAEVNTSVMKFTANKQQIIGSNCPPIATTISPTVGTSVGIRTIEDESLFKNAVLCPDPCTSQTATRWELLNNLSTGSHSSHQYLKRRNDSSDEELEEELRTPVKQHISEDKVSAIFNRLYITNNNMFDINEKIDCEEFDDQSNDSFEDHSKNPIVFTNELQSAIKNKTITDRLIQNELDKHSKALVLWQPINPILPLIGLNSISTEPESGQTEPNCDLNQNPIDNSNDLDIDFMPNDNYNDFDYQMEI